MKQLEPIINEAKHIQDFLEKECSGEINDMMDRLSKLNVYMARSGEMLAVAVQLQDQAVNATYSLHEDTIKNMPASIADKFIKSHCAEQNALVKWIDRINATCKHQSDNLRTQISFAKEQLSLERRGY